MNINPIESYYDYLNNDTDYDPMKSKPHNNPYIPIKDTSNSITCYCEKNLKHQYSASKLYKTLFLNEEDSLQTEYQKYWGRTMEISARQQIENDLGIKISLTELRNDYESQVDLDANPDGYISEGINVSSTVLVEIKCPFRGGLSVEMNLNDYLQVQQELYVFKCDYLLFIKWNPQGYILWFIQFDIDIWNKLLYLMIHRNYDKDKLKKLENQIKRSIIYNCYYCGYYIKEDRKDNYIDKLLLFNQDIIDLFPRINRNLLYPLDQLALDLIVKDMMIKIYQDGSDDFWVTKKIREHLIRIKKERKQIAKKLPNYKPYKKKYKKKLKSNKK